MHLPHWFWYVAIVLVLWGVVGLFQKLCTNYISAETALICAVAGWVFLLFVLRSGRPLSSFSDVNIFWAVFSGTLNALGAWGLLAAMRNGAKASVVVPLTALYPLVVVVVSPLVLHEMVTLKQAGGVVSSIIAVVLLSKE
jgi:bacterial/archaeal transporter family protein